MNWRDQSLSLQNISQCKTDLDFAPLAHWPTSLPAMAVNGWVLAGFGQSLVVNHSIPESEPGKIADLFQSLHPDLSWAEVAELWLRSRRFGWFPVQEIAGRYHFRLNSHFQELALAFQGLPLSFRKMCAQKKWSGQDFAPLLSAKEILLQALCDKIIYSSLSKVQSVQAFEIGIELLLMNQSADSLHLLNDQWRGEIWLQHLQTLRYPETLGADQTHQNQLQSELAKVLPGSTQIRWVRQGDKAGLEVKMFLSHPTDLAKQMNSLQQMQAVLEKGPWKKH